MALSAFLSGYRPYYDVERPHPNSILHDKLVNVGGESLFDQVNELIMNCFHILFHYVKKLSNC